MKNMEKSSKYKRFVSAVLDFILLFFIWPVVWYLVYQLFISNEGITQILVTGFASCAIVWILLGICEVVYGQTPATKYFANLKIYSQTGEDVFWLRLKRFLIKYAWAIWQLLGMYILIWLSRSSYLGERGWIILYNLYLGIFAVLITSVIIAWVRYLRTSNRALYDRWSGTEVYKIKTQ